MKLLSPDTTERVYDFITEDDEGRTCEAIPDSACKEAPRNFILNALNGSATKLACVRHHNVIYSDQTLKWSKELRV